MNKKNFKISKIFSLFLILAVLLHPGCQKAEIDETPDASTVLITKLREFNESYSTNNIGQDNLKSAQGFWSTVGDALVVSGADLIGAAAGAVAVKELAVAAGVATGGTGAAVVMGAGAVIAGGGASVAAYRELKSANMSNIISGVYSGNLNIVYPDKYKDLANCGYNHNKEVFSILNGDLSYSYLKSGTLNNDDQKIFESSEWQSIIEEINSSVNDYKLSKNTDELIESLENKSLITNETSLVLNIFFDIYNQIEQSEHVEDIINFYIESISTAQCLSEDEKISLICSFSVASESLFLWLNQYSNEASN